MRINGACLPVLVLALTTSALAQGISENPAKPLAKNAGRVLALTEVWRITDDSGNFYLKYPHELRLADDGTVFLHDVNQLLKFSPAGQFFENLFKKGQGPGEMTDGAFQYQILGPDLFILDRNTGRFWRADKDGTYLGSIDISGLTDPDFIGAGPAGLLFTTFDAQAMFTASGYIDLPRTVWGLGTTGGTPKKILTVPCRSFRGKSVQFGPLVIKLGPEGKALYTVSGWDYRIDVHDAATGAAVKSFTRPYPKFKPILTDEQEKWLRESGMPRYEFAPDINDLYPTSDGVWVETSTDDKDKGRLYDVFDKDGRFLDSFCLGPGKTLMAVRDGFVYCQEKSEDETFMIVKYKVEK